MNPTTNQPLLRWTGHPLADVGVATLCAMRDKTDPDQLSAEDLDEAAREIERAYQHPVMNAYLCCVFTNNAAYTFPNATPEKRRAEYRRVLFAHRSAPDEGTSDLRCVFSGAPATHLIHRANMPLLTGRGVLNFFPAGRSELPVSGPYLVALQSLPMGGRRAEGKLLIVHCDNPQWTLTFAQRYLEDNRRLLSLAHMGAFDTYEGPFGLLNRELTSLDKNKRHKLPDVAAPRSLVMDDLQTVASHLRPSYVANMHPSITIYVANNFGKPDIRSRDSTLAMFFVPSQLVSFIRAVNSDPYGDSWRRLVALSWRQSKRTETDDESRDAPDKLAKKRSRSEKSDKPRLPGGPGKSRNELYNDLYPIFETGDRDLGAAQTFLRRHLLRDPMRWLKNRQNDAYKLRARELPLIDWKLAKLFLQEVLGMNNERIDRIREFADRLARAIAETNDKRLFAELVFKHRFFEIRNALTKAQQKYARGRSELLFDFDDFLNVFMADDAVGAADWGLVRDLISIRLVEKLFNESEFFKKNPDVLEQDEPEGQELDNAEEETE